jgi:hydroxymethylbilane synthase
LYKKQNILEQKIRIGSRGSDLALWQANHAKDQLAAVGVEVDIRIIKTQGDQVQHLSFDKMEGKGFFTKEIEDALLRGDIDLAVHSMKDLPTEQPEGLVITAVSYREDPADWLVLRRQEVEKGALFKLKEKAVVGTSSARRKAQMLHFRPDVQIKDVRGNVPTRLDKLRRGDFHAVLLAAAGLCRLEMDLSEFEVVKMNPKEFIPAPAQGVLAFQTLRADTQTRLILQKIHHREVSARTNIERKVLQLMEGGCHMPLGVYCERDAQGHYHVWAAVADTWNSPLRRAQLSSGTHYRLAEKVVKALKE